MTTLTRFDRSPPHGSALRADDPIRRRVTVWRRVADDYWLLSRSYPLLYLFESGYFEDGTGGRKDPFSGEWIAWFEEGVDPNG
jgi:hypothetical protein